MKLSNSLKTIAITATGIGLVSLALAAHPGQAEFSASDASNTMLMAQAPDGPPSEGAPDGGPGGAPPEMGQRWMSNLGLSADQMTRMKAIRDQYQPQLKTNREAMKKARDEFRQLMEGTASDDQLRQKHTELENLHQQAENLRFESMLAIRNILTPDQRKKAADLMEKHHQEMRDRWENRQQNGGGMMRRRGMNPSQQNQQQQPNQG